jgi:hypothetical protein
MDKWLEACAKKKGTTKNDILRELVYKAMEAEARERKEDTP